MNTMPSWNGPKTLYVTYIVTTPEKLWAALTSGEITRQYFFGRRIESDWKTGSVVRYWQEDGTLDVEGTILECESSVQTDQKMLPGSVPAELLAQVALGCCTCSPPQTPQQCSFRVVGIPRLGWNALWRYSWFFPSLFRAGR